MNIQDIQSARMRSKRIAQETPVYQPAFQFTVPHIERRRGWISPDVQLAPYPGSVPPTQAPAIMYRNLKFLQENGTPLPVRKNRERHLVQAPAIVTTY